MRAVISLGGSLISEASAAELEAYANAIEQVEEGCESLVLVVGAGELKHYIEKARELGVPETIGDLIGIRCSRLNACLLKSVLGLKSEIPQSVQDLADRSGERTIVMGGTEPGHSTDSVAALAADVTNADLLLNATYVDGVYAEDPQQNPDAEKLENLNYQELIDLLRDKEVKAGSYAFFDLTGAKVLQRAGIPMKVVDGRQPQAIVKAIKGNDSGSLVEPEADG